MHIRLNLLAAAAGLVLSTAAFAQSGDRPWYVGLTQDFSHESNPLGLPPGTEQGDNISTTTLRGGLNLPFGRQRVYANALLDVIRYNDFSQRNNNEYAIGAGLDWSTVERLSGNLTFNANQQQSDFIIGGVVPVSVSNLERSQDISALFRLGVVTALSFDARLGARLVDFTAPEYAASEYKQENASLGVSYRTSGILSLGAGFRGERTRYQWPAPGQTEPDQSDRQDFYIAADWVPTGATTVNARLFFGKLEYKLATAADFEGVTGSVVWAWQPTGLLRLRTTLSRDTGQESGYLRLDNEGATVSASDFSQITNALTLRAEYLMTGKVTLTGDIGYAKRDFVDGFTGATGKDDTTLVSLGARWAATRTLAFGCNASRESRSASGFGSSDSDNDRFGCFGQIALD
jgi:hypothetical protein